jgi:hypothetical protein
MAKEEEEEGQDMNFPLSLTCRWLKSCIPAGETNAFAVLARAADVSDRESAGQTLCLKAKAAVMRDRAESAREAGYLTCVTQLLQPELQAYKADMLIGYMPDRGGENLGEG